MTIDKTTPKNNFATAPAFPLFEAAAYRKDLSLFGEMGPQPPLTDKECHADELKAAPGFPPPDEFLIWNPATGRYDFDVEKFDAGRVCHD